MNNKQVQTVNTNKRRQHKFKGELDLRQHKSDKVEYFQIQMCVNFGSEFKMVSKGMLHF